MKKTQNYQLSQWDATDRILREDFNGDNAKIDAAIAAVRKANPFETIRDITTSADAKQIDVDVSDVDWMKYIKIEMNIVFPKKSLQYVLRINELTLYRQQICTGGGSTNTQEYLAFAGCFEGGNQPFQDWRFNTPQGDSAVECVCAGITGVYWNYYLARACGCNWSQVKTMNLLAMDKVQVMPAGTRIQILGVKA